MDNIKIRCAVLIVGLIALSSLSRKLRSLSLTTTGPARENLPQDLVSWRKLYDYQPYRVVWNQLIPLLAQDGLRLWLTNEGCQAPPIEEYPLPDNYTFLGPNKIKNHSAAHLKNYKAFNGLSHAARSEGRRDYVLRVMTAGGQGQDHLQIMRRLSSPPDILRGNNHILPMVGEISFQDIVIGMFPRVAHTLDYAMSPVPMNSVGDVLYMVLQALEGIAYLHDNLIAHRDLFPSNFMVEWCPESINERGGMTRPRVYIIDFETAVEFPEFSWDADRRVSGIPSVFPQDIYKRPRGPELESEKPYCPFRMDIWQFGYNFHEYYPTGLAEIDQLWAELVSGNPEDRPTARQAMHRLDNFLRTTPPSLHIRPLVPEIVWD